MKPKTQSTFWLRRPVLLYEDEVEEIWRLVNRLEGETVEAVIETRTHKFEDLDDLKSNAKEPLTELEFKKTVRRGEGKDEHLQTISVKVGGITETELTAFPERDESLGILYSIDQVLTPHYLEEESLNKQMALKILPWWTLAVGCLIWGGLLAANDVDLGLLGVPAFVILLSFGFSRGGKASSTRANSKVFLSKRPSPPPTPSLWARNKFWILSTVVALGVALVALWIEYGFLQS